MKTQKLLIAPRRRIDWLARELSSPEDRRLYAQERCIVAVTEAVARAHRGAGLAQSEVARRIGRTKAHISRLLSGRRNMTLRSLADLLWACGLEVSDVRLEPVGVSVVPSGTLARRVRAPRRVTRGSGQSPRPVGR